MSKKVSAKNKEKISKKDFRKEVMQKLAEALAVYKQELGDKKFESRVRKASKLFSRNIVKIHKKKKEKTPEPETIKMSIPETL
ncbi:MAG: hypothetical protein EPN92_14580 [Chitinophagaceae bacterium]|nr:MAG: hypothetical protein EPN92_14580 [Chitinophagaceae bacterium]